MTCTLPAQYRMHGLSTHLHYFAEKHGKSAVDGHFSLLSRWLKQAAAQQQILTTSQLIDALRQQVAGHLQATRSDEQPLHRVTFESYTPSCQQHQAGEHDSLVPAAAPVNARQHSPSLDDEGDTCMHLPASSTVSAATAAACCDHLDDDGDVTMAVGCDAAEHEDVQVTDNHVSSAASASVHSEDRTMQQCSTELQPSSARQANSIEGQRHCSRLAGEGRVFCVRQPTVIPSIRFDEPTSLSTHYYFHAPTLPVLHQPDGGGTSQSDQVSDSRPTLPAAPHQPVSVPMHVGLVRNSVWPLQIVRATYSENVSTTKTIAFAPRLQESPQIVVHPNSLSAMRRRLTVFQSAFPQLRANQARSLIDSIAQQFTCN